MFESEPCRCLLRMRVHSWFLFGVVLRSEAEVEARDGDIPRPCGAGLPRSSHQPAVVDYDTAGDDGVAHATAHLLAEPR